MLSALERRPGKFQPCQQRIERAEVVTGETQLNRAGTEPICGDPAGIVPAGQQQNAGGDGQGQA